MVFSSTVFLFLFLPLVIFIYYASPRKFRNGVLFISSLVFYSWGEPVYILVMLFSTVFDYVNGLLIERNREHGNLGGAKAVMIISVVINLSILGFFKYGNFVIDNLNLLLGTGFSPLDVSLPIGISFYTFQTMSYTIDVYRGDAPVQRSFISFGAFVAMFPQLVAGPIVRYRDIALQLDSRRESPEDLCCGIRRFICGLFKKLVFANSFGILWEQISGGSAASLSAASAWFGAIAFSLQIYFDFSGYSDMAIGLGRMFGFTFLENFDHPYRSKSAAEFWRRWHMSLGTWFREYVYIPLGGSRGSTLHTVRNLMIVWSLTGLWHGASWNFLLWGLYFGVLITLEKLFLFKFISKLPSFIQHLYGLFLAVTGWVIFAFEDIAQVGKYLRAMFVPGKNGILSPDALYYLSSNFALLLLGAAASVWLPRRLRGLLHEEALSRTALCAQTLVFAALFFTSLCFLVGSTYNPFLYFRF